MASQQETPLYKDILKLIKNTDQIVNKFAKNRKYTLGQRLFDHNLAVLTNFNKASYLRAQKRINSLEDLRIEIENYKTLAQVGKELGCFKSFAEFETLIKLALSIARQNEGWIKAEKNNLNNSNARVGI